LVHRDLKPDNILITREGRLVLLDFGLAIEWQRASSAELVGTMLYIAPEQLTGLPLTAAADWYAVGVILYEALTGTLPYDLDHALDVAWKREHPPEPPAQRDPALPADLSELCMQLLCEEPQQRPGDADVARRLGLDPEVERGRASFRSRLQYVRDLFIGRREELASLHAIQRRTQAQGGVVVYIHGESGVGKSALVRHFLDELSHVSPEVEILSGRCYERESVPYSGLDRVVDDLSRKLRERQRHGDTALFVPRRASLLGQVFPVLRAVDAFNRSPARLSELDPFEARRLAFAALRELLAAIADEQPLVVHIDDTQWLDAESAALLEFLLTGPESPRMLLLLTERSAGTSRAQHTHALLTAASEFVPMHLGPLAPRDSEQLALSLMSRLGGSSSEPALVALHSGGHPLFIHELVMHGSTRSGPWAPSLESALSVRITALQAPARALLELIALAATPLSHEVARAASGLLADAYPWALFTLRSENLVVFSSLASGAEVQLYHDRIRELVVSHVGNPHRAQLHERLARAIEQQTPHALDALAHHFLHAGVHAEAARYARAGAQRALASLAFAQAARLFQLALQIEANSALRAELEEGLGRALANAGRGVEAAEAYLRAAGSSLGHQALELRRRGGEQLLRSGRVDQGLAVLFELARVSKVRIPRRTGEYALSVLRALSRIELSAHAPSPATAPREIDRDQQLRANLCWTLAAGLTLVNTGLATHFLARSAELAIKGGDDERALRSMATLGASLCQVDALRLAGRRVFSHARELQKRVPSAENEAWLALDSGIAALADGDFANCETLCLRAQSAFRDHCTGVAWEVVTSQAFALWAMVYQGKMASLSERLPAIVADAQSRDDRFAFATLMLGPLHLVGLAQDEPARVREQCDAAMRDWTADLCVFQRMCALFVRAQVELYEGRAAASWSRLCNGWSELEDSMSLQVRFHRIELIGLRARAALSCAVIDAAGRARWLSEVSADIARLEREKVDFGKALAASLAAGRAVLQNDRAAAIVRLERAREGFFAHGMMLHAGLASIGLAVLNEAHDEAAAARQRVAELGVSNVGNMQRLWLPGIPIG
jgi:hypothetical protein